MDQDSAPPAPETQPASASSPQPPGSSPRLLSDMKGWIAGATALVVALGGLATAYKEMWGSKPADPPAPANVQAPSEPAAPQQAVADAADASAEPEAGNPINYKGQLVDEGKVVTIDWDGENWILTIGGEDAYRFDETFSPDETKVLAVSNGSYLRWPIDGGEVDRSDDKVRWETFAHVEVAETN